MRFVGAAESEEDSNPEEHSVNSNFEIFARPLVHGDTILGRVWLEAQDNTMALKCTRVGALEAMLIVSNIGVQTYHVNIKAVARVNVGPAWKMNIDRWRETILEGGAEGTVYLTGVTADNKEGKPKIGNE